jgi:hypothetical protein
MKAKPNRLRWGRHGRARVIGLVLAIIPAAVVAALIGWRMVPKPAPSPNGDIVAVAKFVSSSQFDSLTESQKKPYMHALRKRLADLANAAGAGKISKSEYAYALEQIWMIRQLEHLEQYYQLPPGVEREKFLDALTEKGVKASATQPAPPAKNAALREEIVKSWLASWPEDRRQQWEEFRKAITSKKQAASSKPAAAKRSS